MDALKEEGEGGRREGQEEGKGKEKREEREKWGAYSGAVMIIAFLEYVHHFIWIYYYNVLLIFGHKLLNIFLVYKSSLIK